MSHKLSNGTNAHRLSTDYLVNVFEHPVKKKDRNIAAAVLRLRGVNVQRFLFLKKLEGPKPLVSGDTAYMVVPGDAKQVVREVFLIRPGTSNWSTEPAFDVEFIDQLLPRGVFRGVLTKKLFHTRKEVEESLR